LGEVQSAVHKALGCVGVITDGSIRDVPQWARAFRRGGLDRTVSRLGSTPKVWCEVRVPE